MEKQYRIKQIGGKFFLQAKKFLFWHNVWVYERHISIAECEHVWKSFGHRSFSRSSSASLSFLEGTLYCFRSLEEAKKFLNDYVLRPHIFEYKGHTIIETYNGYFVDVTCNVYTGEYNHETYYDIVAKSYEKIKEEIDEFETKWAESKVRKVYKV